MGLGAEEAVAAERAGKRCVKKVCRENQSKYPAHLIHTWLFRSLSEKDSLCETPWNLCASVVKIAQKQSTTETQSSHRGPQSLFSDRLLKPDVNEKQYAATVGLGLGQGEQDANRLFNPDRLDIHELADPKVAQFPAVTGVLYTAKRQTRI